MLPEATGLPADWIITEGMSSQGYDFKTAGFSLIVKWNGTGEKTPFEARGVVFNWLNRLQQDKTTLAVEQLDQADLTNGQISDYSTHWQLTKHLYGLPASDLAVDEIDGTQGKVFLAVAAYGKTTGATSNSARSSANSESANKITQDEGSTVEVSHSLSAGVTATTIDSSPLRFWLGYYREKVFFNSTLFGANDEPEAIQPPFTPGLINVRQLGVAPSVVDETTKVIAANPSVLSSFDIFEGVRTEVDGLEYSSPPVNRNLTMRVTGDLAAAQVKLWADAADRGTLNTDYYQLSGVVYRPLELCFCSFNVTTDASGVHNLQFGFSSSKRTLLRIPASNTVTLRNYDGSTWTNTTYSKTDVAGVLMSDPDPSVDDDTEFYLPSLYANVGDNKATIDWDARDASTIGGDMQATDDGSVYLVISPFDYVWSFVVKRSWLASQLAAAERAKATITKDANGDDIAVMSRPEYFGVQKIFDEASFYSLFGQVDQTDTNAP